MGTAEPEPIPIAPPRRAPQDPWYVRWTLTLLAVGVLTVLVIVPIAAVFFHALETGLGVYWRNLILDPDTRHSILLTLAVAPTAVLLNLVFGVAAAWAIARRFGPHRAGN